MILPQIFYAQDTITVAKQLLGCYLTHLQGNQTTLGRIVETEAYLGIHDPASHAYIGQTLRNRVLFGPVGRAYIYFIYGLHHCANAVTGPQGTGEAVLIRALEPLQGIPTMQHRRKTENLTLLCSGPARLTQSLAITLAHNGLPLFNSPLQIWTPVTLPSLAPIQPTDIIQTTRIGLTKAKDLPLRFYIKGNSYISRK